ncbi:MAG TPA: cobalamin biosynthesis protein CobQ [Spongiibacteraceae bacterium]|nr:cobalamin biosynthesis protein CobQ [Spongiibacteraceae bacterium]HCS29266.1 cobalamin biosynthesis protein CobQ [Spongiibacteraceae bacterium]|tara:strand:- start:561 stop:1361 length:801 start_codon:yes stop_codon:yes gene_type:complete
MKRVVFNQKGGVGKTSITCNLAAISAWKGYKTLVIDLDVQGNSSEYLIGAQFRELTDNAADFFRQKLSFFGKGKEPKDFIYNTEFENLFLMPSNPELASIERDLESRHKIYKLRDALENLSGEYEHIYIDTPPALNFYSRSALIAADSLLIPFDCDSFSSGALMGLLETVAEIREDHNPNLTLEGVVVNQFQVQASLPQQLTEELTDMGLPLFDTFLSSSVKMKESRTRQTPLIYMAQSHKLTQQLLAIHADLEDNSKKHKRKKTA